MNFGWRARVGFVETLRTIESTPYYFYQMAPKGVGLILTSLRKESQDPVATTKALGRLDKVLSDLKEVEVDYVLIASSPTVLFNGVDAPEKIINLAESVCGVKATTTTTAALRAIQHLNISNVALVSPYKKQNQRMVEYLETNGIKVISSDGLEQPLNMIGRIPPENAYKLVKNAFYNCSERPDAIYIPGGLMQIVPYIDTLEKDLDVTIITSTQASVWAVCQDLCIKESISGYGRLLE